MTQLLAAFAAFLILASSPLVALGQYPAKPIRMVVPFPPGGAADIAARIVAAPLAQVLGQPILIDNKSGADGAIAGQDVMRAAPDGYTLLFATNTGLCAAPAMRKVPPYDPIADFTPISQIGKFGFFVFVHPSVPANSLSELLDYVRANPGKLNYGTGNSTSIITAAQLSLLERLNMMHIPYKGDAPLSADLLAGRVQLSIATPGTSMQHAKDGRLRVLATLLAKRSPLAPEVPTMAEAGVPRLSISSWGGLFGPAKMPKEVVDRVARATAVVLARRDVLEQLDRIAFEGRSSSPEELGILLKEQLGLWQKTLREVGIVPD
ncbi:MAG: tripartite tricarboxylate transporter substrate binding protein [Betaproteobacteria bacterium]